MILLVGFYSEPNVRRAAEFMECLRRNCGNPRIREIHVFLEDGSDPRTVMQRQAFLRNDKVTLVPHGRRLTYDDLFGHANLFPGRRVIIANADIFFDETIALLDGYDLHGWLLCLARWDEGPGGTARHFDRPDSQDAWIFAPPVANINCAFHLGVPGCDNRLAYEADRAGLLVTNPSKSIRARHLHRSGLHRYTARDRLQGPFRRIATSTLEADATPPLSSMDRSVRERCQAIELVLRPHLGADLPAELRREIHRAVLSMFEVSEYARGIRTASVSFRETMGYSLLRLETGASSHNNDSRPFKAVPAALAGKWFTQVVANRVSPVEVEFRSAGELYVLAARGWEGYVPAAAFLDRVGCRESMEPLETRDGTVFDIWLVSGDVGQRLVVPTQVMLVADEIAAL